MAKQSENKKEVTDRIATSIRARRLNDTRYSQEYVANVLKVHPSTYSRFETGHVEITISKAMALADLYGITLDELVGNCPEGNPDPPTIKEPKISYGTEKRISELLFKIGKILVEYGEEPR